MEKYWSYLRFALPAICLAGMIKCSNDWGLKKAAESDRMLSNGIFIKGRITGVIESNNHAFGIISIDVDTANTRLFTDTLKDAYFPYKVKGNKAELYVSIPDGVQKGDEVKIESDKQLATYHCQKNNRTDESDISLVLKDGVNDVFIKTHSQLR